MGNYTQKFADLHVHLEGTMSPQTLQELARKNGVDLSAPTEFLHRDVIPAPSPQSIEGPFNADFREFIRLYCKGVSCLREPEDILLLGERYLETATTDGVVAADLYFSPAILMLLGVEDEVMLRGLEAVQQLATTKYDFRIRWIFDLLRGGGLDGSETVDFATKFRDAGINVVYVGLGGLEAGNPAAPFKTAFDMARDRGFRILAHAGETAGPESIWETIEAANPERIGHGVTCMKDDRLVKHLRDNETILEVSPWSNVLLGIYSEEQHPLREMFEAGLSVVICSDDPGIFGRSLLSNYDLARKLGVSSDLLERARELSLRVQSI